MSWGREGGGADKWRYSCNWLLIVWVCSPSSARTACRLVWLSLSLSVAPVVLAVVSTVTADEIKAIVIAASSSGAESHDSHMSSDEDEGTVVSERWWLLDIVCRKK